MGMQKKKRLHTCTHPYPISVKLGHHNYLQLKFCSKKEKTSTYFYYLESYPARLTTFALYSQISGLCQALNDILDNMSSKGIAIPVWVVYSSFCWMVLVRTALTPPELAFCTVCCCKCLPCPFGTNFYHTIVWCDVGQNACLSSVLWVFCWFWTFGGWMRLWTNHARWQNMNWNIRLRRTLWSFFIHPLSFFTF